MSLIVVMGMSMASGIECIGSLCTSIYFGCCGGSIVSESIEIESVVWKRTVQKGKIATSHCVYRFKGVCIDHVPCIVEDY